MAGVNLSQSYAEDESEEKGFFHETRLLASIGIVMLAVVCLGGTRLYIGMLDKKINALDESLNASTLKLRGEKIDRIYDFDTRVGYFVAHAADLTDIRNILKQLEAGVIEKVSLTAFEYNRSEKVVFISGTVDDFKGLSEQIMAFKEQALFADMAVERVVRNKENKIEFGLKALLQL